MDASIERKQEGNNFFGKKIGKLTLSDSSGIDSVTLLVDDQNLTIRVGVSTLRGTGTEYLGGHFSLNFSDALRQIPIELLLKLLPSEITKLVGNTME